MLCDWHCSHVQPTGISPVLHNLQCQMWDERYQMHRSREGKCKIISSWLSSAWKRNMAGAKGKWAVALQVPVGSPRGKISNQCNSASVSYCLVWHSLEFHFSAFFLTLCVTPLTLRVTETTSIFQYATFSSFLLKNI